jgi:hypothetical protein
MQPRPQDDVDLTLEGIFHTLPEKTLRTGVDVRLASGLRGEAHSLSSGLLGGRFRRREDSDAGSSLQGGGQPDIG